MVMVVRKGILARPFPRTLNSEEKEKPVEVKREPSAHTLEVKKRQKSVLRQFRRLSPVCDAVREKFHVKKKVETTEDLFKSTEDTNLLFGVGHCHSNNAKLNRRKIITRYNHSDPKRSYQFSTFEPSSAIEENWNLFLGTETPQETRPATHASSRSSAKPPNSRPLSRRSSVASRIQSTTNRMKSKHVRSKVAGSIARHLTDATAELDNGPKHHLEYFLDSLNLDTVDNQGDGVKGGAGDDALIVGRRQLEHQGSLAHLPSANYTSKSGNYAEAGSDQKLFRRPMNPKMKTSRLPKFEISKFRPSPFGSVHFGDKSYENKFPSSVRELRLVPDYMKETPVLAIMKLPSLNTNVTELHNLRS